MRQKAVREIKNKSIKKRGNNEFLNEKWIDKLSRYTVYFIVLIIIKFKCLYSVIKIYWLKCIHNLQGHNVSNGMQDTKKGKTVHQRHTKFMLVIKSVYIGIGLTMYAAITSSAICKLRRIGMCRCQFIIWL